MTRHSKLSKQKKILVCLLRKKLTISMRVMQHILSDDVDVVGIIKRDSFEFYRSQSMRLYEIGETSFRCGVERDVFDEIMGMCRPRDAVITSVIRLTIFLQYAREGLTQSVLSKNCGVSQPTISRILCETIDDINRFAGKFIRFPQSRADVLDLQSGFFDKLDRNGDLRCVPCYGVLDGKHWETEHPPNSGSLSFNYKAYCSFNSLFVCSADCRILYVQISECGGNSDAQLFREGPLGELLERAAYAGGLRTLPGSSIVMPPFILADNGFGLSKHVMQPYRDHNRTTENMDFNDKICGTRVKIENLFGILTTKFRVFRRALNLCPTSSQGLILSLSVIHNLTVPKREAVQFDYETPILIDPYKTAEDQRTALKKYLKTIEQ
ncbi:unnamed protein product [Caenorhabditis sp. 36 PRJEB53466]|nr:unnamed protein product [Caenorhabditis sp. 36 PRJEB53466]